MGSLNLVGGKYSNSADTAIARSTGATSILLNPAGLSQEKSSSISSGASAYSYELSNQNGNKYLSTSSSTSHVAAVKEFNNIVLGFMIYTALSSDLKTKRDTYSKDQNGNTFGAGSSSEMNINLNTYILSITPKNSTWGLSFNINQKNTKVSNQTITKNYSSTPTNREHSQISYQVEQQEYTINLSFSQQLDLTSKLKFGYKFTTPTYLIMGSGNYKMDYLAVTGSGTNDSNMVLVNTDVDSKVLYSYDSESLNLGLSYFYNDKSVFDIALFYSGGYSRSKNKYLDDGLTSYWLSQTDTYGEGISTIENSDSTSNSHNSLGIGFGHEYSISDEYTYGIGLVYSPSNSKNKEGVHSYIFSTGITQSYKNFTGSYGLNYQKGVDAGNNKSYDSILKRDVKVKNEFESISFMLSGAYYF